MSQQILSKTTVFDANAFTVEKLHVRLPDKRERDYSLVHHHDSVTIIPLDSENNVILVTQFRMGSESVLLELPAGTMDEGEKPLECALREIREETGMAAGKMEHLGSIYLAPGYSSELNHIFLATDLTESPLQMDDDEFLNSRKIPLADIPGLAAGGQLQDSKSLAALYLAGDKLSMGRI
jgi:ADP-ribose pyrophosphatase